MSLAAKPTLYKDIMFRSRLEARWAAFFDIAGWRWAYEPFDLEGWTPDFQLKGAANDVLVEVKPIDWFDDGPEVVLQFRDLEKVRRLRSGPAPDAEMLKKTELMVVGDGPQLV